MYVRHSPSCHGFGCLKPRHASTHMDLVSRSRNLSASTRVWLCETIAALTSTCTHSCAYVLHLRILAHCVYPCLWFLSNSQDPESLVSHALTCLTLSLSYANDMGMTCYYSITTLLCVNQIAYLIRLSLQYEICACTHACADTCVLLSCQMNMKVGPMKVTHAL